VALPPAEKHKEYWRKNLTITAILLAAWFVLTLVIGCYARELHELAMHGFPPALYAVIIGIYAWYMSRLDRNYDS